MANKKKARFPHETGKCQVCADQGILPSEAVVCYLHSIALIKELRAEIAVLKDTAGASSRLHLAIAGLENSVPSVDGSEELAFVKELLTRADTVRDAIEAVLKIVNYENG